MSRALDDDERALVILAALGDPRVERVVVSTTREVCSPALRGGTATLTVRFEGVRWRDGEPTPGATESGSDTSPCGETKRGLASMGPPARRGRDRR